VMKKSESLFGQLNNEVRRNSADKATAFHRSSLREKALPKNVCRPKNSVNLCESVSNLPLCLGVFVAETQLVRRSLGEGGFLNAMKKSKSLFGRLILKVGRTPDKAGQHCCQVVETKIWHTNHVWSTSFVENTPRPKLCVLSALCGINLGNFYLSNL
jgi:hypothetical protein